MQSILTGGLQAIPILLLAIPGTAQGSCGDWVVLDVPMPAGATRAEFADVVGFADGGAFAVGSAVLPTPPFGPENVTLAMHYDGQQWTHTPTPYVAPYSGGANDWLHAVDAVGPDDVWAAGERYGDAGGMSSGAWLHVLHWDGSSWSQVPVPDPPGGAGINFSGTRVYDIEALAADDVWFAGMWAEPNAQAAVTWRPLAMHWDGSGMSIVTTPVLYSNGYAMHMSQMAAVAPDDIWGICRTNTAGGYTDNPTLLHYDGSNWSAVTGPNLGSDVALRDIVVRAADDVWVFGHRYWNAAPFTLRWNGSSWSVVEGLPHVSSASPVHGGELHLGSTQLDLFDGSGTTTLETFPGFTSVAVQGMDGLAGSCSAWAVGRRFGGTDFVPLAAVLRPAGEGAGIPFCVGDGSVVPCPCDNASSTGANAGCTNSGGAAGVLRATGTPSLAADSLRIEGSGMTAGFVVYLQSTIPQMPTPFGDGLLCSAAPIVRLATKQNAGGASSFPEAGDPSLSVRGLIGTPGTIVYQAVYRDPGSFCTPSTFNTTNALRIDWLP